jgi:serine/threonine protein kinase
MEYIQGKSLEALIQEGLPLPNLVLLELFHQLMEGLRAAHAKGIIHRDIKPSNLLISREGTLKIADFGIAHVIQQDSLTATGQFLGTPQFSSPEVIRQSGSISGRADVFSAGCILYLCASGVSPFQGENPHQTLHNVCELELSKPAEANPRLLPVFNGLAELALIKNPEHRPEAAVLAEKIEDFFLDSRLKRGKWRLKAFMNNRKAYQAEEDKTLFNYLSNLAEASRVRGKTADAHRIAYQARLFSSSPSSLSAPNKRLAPGKKRIIIFSIFFLSLIGAILTLRSLLADRSITESPGLPKGDSQPAPSFPDTPALPPPVVDLKTTPAKGTAITPKPQTRMGYLHIKSKPPFTTIILNGKSNGVTPLKRPLRLKPGVHHLKVEKTGWRPASQKLNITPGDTLNLAVELQRLK